MKIQQFFLCLGLLIPLHALAAPEGEAIAIRVLVTPAKEALLSSQMAGKILSMTVEEGGTFKEGDPLVLFDCREHEAERSKMRAQLEAKSRGYESSLKLKRMGSISDLEAAVSEAEVKQAYAEVSLADVRISMCRLTAPFFGRVFKRKANPHENVAIGQPLLEVIDDSQLRLSLIIPSRWLSWINIGQEFSVHIDETGNQYPARLTGIGAKVDPVSQTVEVKGALIGSSPALLSGMSGSALFRPVP